jgi:hypothetical protein
MTTVTSFAARIVRSAKRTSESSWSIVAVILERA